MIKLQNTSQAIPSDLCLSGFTQTAKSMRQDAALRVFPDVQHVETTFTKRTALLSKRKISDSEGIRFFLFHRYFGQLKAPFLKYAIDLMNKTGLPVVYIANDYSKEEEPQLNVAAFDEWDYNEISSRNDCCL